MSTVVRQSSFYCAMSGTRFLQISPLLGYIQSQGGSSRPENDLLIKRAITINHCFVPDRGVGLCRGESTPRLKYEDGPGKVGEGHINQ